MVYCTYCRLARHIQKSVKNVADSMSVTKIISIDNPAPSCLLLKRLTTPVAKTSIPIVAKK